MSQAEIIAALQQALAIDAGNGPLWAHLGQLLVGDGDDDGAIAAFRKAFDLGNRQSQLIAALAAALRRQGQLSEALIRVEQALEKENHAQLRIELARILLARDDSIEARKQYQLAIRDNPQLADRLLAVQLEADVESSPSSERHAGAEYVADEVDTRENKDTDQEQRLLAMSANEDSAPSLDDFDWQRESVSFQDVVGLEDVKRQIHLRIVAPFKQQQIFQAFSRKAGGGILLYGPPGCGKTFIARATAGEVGAQFISVGIHDIIDKYFGESEKMVHTLFEEARRRSPAVLFFDEFDALGGNRRGGESQYWKTLVDQLLQEMDGVGKRNENVLVFAATNAPWNIDSAFRRPGRFDRTLFVPPPDANARAEMLRRHLIHLPGGDTIAVDGLASTTELFTGADLRSLCERASEGALSRSLESGRVHPVLADDFRREIRVMRSSAEEWLATARNYAKYSNDGGQYDELTDYLKRAKRW